MNDTLVARIAELEADMKKRDEAEKKAVAEVEKAHKLVDRLNEGKGDNTAVTAPKWEEQVDAFLKEAIGGREYAAKRFMEAAVVAGSATPEIWADEVARLRDESPFAVLKPFVHNVPDARRMGSKIYFPTLNPITYAELSVGTQPTETAVTVNNVACTIVERGSLILLNKSTEEDAIPSLRNELTTRMAEGAAYDWDGIVLGWLGAPATAIGGTVSEAGVMKGTVIAKAIGSLMAGTAQAIGACLVVHPVQYASLCGDTQFSDASIRGGDRDRPIQNYLGVNIVVSPQVVSTGGTYRAFLFTRDCVYVADKRDVTIESLYDPGSRQTKIMCSQRFGGTIVQPAALVEIKTVNG